MSPKANPGTIDKRKTMPHLFKKGVSGNPKGKPPDCERIPEVFMLKEALKKVEKETGVPFLEVFVRMAYKHRDVAIALAKKLIPDKIIDENGGLKHGQYIVIVPAGTGPAGQNAGTNRPAIEFHLQPESDSLH